MGNLSNEKLTGPGFEYNDGVIRLRDSVASSVQDLWTNSTLELCLRRKSTAVHEYTISDNDTQVEAVTFYVSKSVYLTAVGIGNAYSWTSVLQTLQILNSSKTS